MNYRSLLVIAAALGWPATGRADLVADARAALTKGAAQLVDVRELSEWRAGHIAGAVHLPLSQLERAKIIPSEIAKDKPVYLYCRSGRRSGIAAKILQKQGYDAHSLPAGFDELKRRGFAAAQ
jgi:phage shock protein E